VTTELDPARGIGVNPGADAALELLTGSPEATRAFAAALAGRAAPGDLVCLWGELGAGKTVFAKGFGAGLGVRETILSPSFVLMGEYAGRLPLFHIDLYRLASAAEALDGGLVDDRQASGVVLIEWPDRLGTALPPDRLDVHIDGGADEPRTLRIDAHGEAHRRYLPAAIAAGAAPASGGPSAPGAASATGTGPATGAGSATGPGAAS
jgi:tRNA threonylcarbamoyladenosine biosynthesis protein TsaE